MQCFWTFCSWCSDWALSSEVHVSTQVNIIMRFHGINCVFQRTSVVACQVLHHSTAEKFNAPIQQHAEPGGKVWVLTRLNKIPTGHFYLQSKNKNFATIFPFVRIPHSTVYECTQVVLSCVPFEIEHTMLHINHNTECLFWSTHHSSLRVYVERHRKVQQRDQRPKSLRHLTVVLGTLIVPSNSPWLVFLLKANSTVWFVLNHIWWGGGGLKEPNGCLFANLTFIFLPSPANRTNRTVGFPRPKRNSNSFFWK